MAELGGIPSPELQPVTAAVEWGGRGPSICVLGVLTHHPWLCWMTSVQPLDLSGPQTPHSEGQDFLIEAVRPQDC